MGFPPGGPFDAATSAERVADAAITVIARDGFDSLSVRAVARQAEVTGGTVQHHFPTKAELVAAALDRTVKRQALRMLVSSAPHEDRPDRIIDRLIAGVCALVPTDDRAREESVTWLAMSAAVPGSRFVAERHASAVAGLRGWIANAIERAAAAGELPAALDARTLAPMIEASIDGVMLQAITEDVDPATLTDRLAAIVRAVLGLPSDAGRP